MKHFFLFEWQWINVNSCQPYKLKVVVSLKMMISKFRIGVFLWVGVTNNWQGVDRPKNPSISNEIQDPFPSDITFLLDLKPSWKSSKFSEFLFLGTKTGGFFPRKTPAWLVRNIGHLVVSQEAWWSALFVAMDVVPWNRWNMVTPLGPRVYKGLYYTDCMRTPINLCKNSY